MELYSVAHIAMKDMQNLRVCYEGAKEDPLHLTMGVPVATTVVALAGDVAAAQQQQAPLTAGLVSYMLHPASPGGSKLLTGMAHFDHMVKMARRTTPRGTLLRPDASLAVEVTPEQSTMILNPTDTDYTIGAIMRAAGGAGGSKALPKRKLGAMCAIRGRSGFLNDEGRMKKMKSQLDLADSIASIHFAQKEEKKVKAAAATEGLFELAPVALAKLRSKGNDVSKLNMKDICAIAHRYLAKDLDAKLKKLDLVLALQALMAAREHVLPAVVLEAGAAATPTVAMAMATEAMQTDDGNDGPASDDEH